jgi:hypothetical protein
MNRLAMNRLAMNKWIEPARDRSSGTIQARSASEWIRQSSIHSLALRTCKTEHPVMGSKSDKESADND